MDRDDALLAKVSRLCDLEIEYDLTVRVLAVLVERLQRLTRAEEVTISDEEISNQPDLTAWRTARHDGRSSMIAMTSQRTPA